MFTAIITVIYRDGTMTTLTDGYAASGIDELDTFLAELLTRSRQLNPEQWIIGFNITVTIS